MGRIPFVTTGFVGHGVELICIYSCERQTMAKINSESEVSELTYHGPLIGMRSTRPKNASSPAQPNPAKPKGPVSETAHKSSQVAR